MTDNNEFMSTKTGELYSGFMVPKQVKYPRGTTFCTLFDDGLGLLLNLGISLTDWRVPFHDDQRHGVWKPGANLASHHGQQA